MAQRSLLTCEACEALAQENQRIWETYYLPRPLYESWETWHAWLAEYRALVRDVQDISEENHGHKPTVSLGVTSAVVSSCGHDSGQIESRVAH